MSISTGSDGAVMDSDGDFDALRESMRAHFAKTISGHEALFRVNNEGLFDVYLDMLPGNQQHYTCNCCRSFMHHFGGLVCIGEDGRRTSPLWSPETAPPFFREAVLRLRNRVENARVVGVVLSGAQDEWGVDRNTAHNGQEWTHFHVPKPAFAVNRNRLKTAGQVAAAKREDFRTLSTALAEYPVAVLEEAVRFIEAEQVARPEKFIAPIRFLLDVKRARDAAPNGAARDAIVWRAVATAPEGWASPRGAVIGTLIEDLKEGLAPALVKRRFNDKTNSLIYQRPQVAPGAGNIKEAEAIVAKLGIAPSLRRRYARLEDCLRVWTPAAPAETAVSSVGVFAHLTPKSVAPQRRPLTLSAGPYTWSKFSDTVLPTAKRMAVKVPTYGPFIALLTAADPDAPPIFKYDSLAERNPASWYVYPGASAATKWNLRGLNAWVPVTALVPLPSMWGSKPRTDIGEGYVFVLEGCRDLTPSGGLALFPELLHNDLHPVRATIEAFSRAGKIEGPDEASACGWDLRKQPANKFNKVVVRVDDGRGETEYLIDRWD